MEGLGHGGRKEGSREGEGGGGKGWMKGVRERGLRERGMEE